MKQYRLIEILQIEFMVGFRHKHDGEFQPLAAVDRHDRNAPGLALAVILPGNAAALGCCIHIANKRAQPGLARLPCPAHEPLQRLPTHTAARHSAHSSNIACIGQNFFQQLCAAHGPGRPAQRLQLCIKLLHFFFAAGRQCAV